MGSLASACGVASEARADDIVIGLYAPITGGQASFGLSLKAGVELAIDETNAKGGVLGGRRLRLVVADTQGRPDEAATAATRLITTERVVAVIGEASSTGSLAGAPICQHYGVPMLAPAATNERVTEVGNYIFRVCYVDALQGGAMARFAWETLEARRVAVFRDATSDYSRGLVESFTTAYAALGGEVVQTMTFSQGDTDFRAQLTAVRNLRPDAIYLPAYYNEAGLVVRQARELGIGVAILGSDGWVSETLGELGGAALNDTFMTTFYAADDPSPAISAFLLAYEKRHGQRPETGAAMGYEAVLVLADALRRAGTTAAGPLREAIAGTQGLHGVTGAISFDARRNPTKPVTVVRNVYEQGRLRQVFQARMGG
jgi:branched-chain amino acid transport system substrate-binding protein